MRLRVDPQGLHDRYVANDPFPHIVIDDLFPDGVLEDVLREFPQGKDRSWRHFDNTNERKSGFDYRAPLQRSVRDFLYYLSSAETLEFLEKLTGIDGLIPDPYFGGAGPHQSFRDGYLKIHADFNWHPKLRLDRRINLLVYLNQDWKEEYGGHLELWDPEMSRCGAKILPLFNRTVVFNTTDVSFHGHPHPLACPEDQSRKSISMYYYTNGRPDEERSAPHDTIFKDVPTG